MTKLGACKRAAGWALAAALVVAGSGSAALAETQAAVSQERRIATLAPRGSAWMKILERGAVELAKETAGRITTKYYPNGVQGDERDVIRKMRLGQLDGAAVTSVGLSLIEPSIRVLELPRMFDSVQELDYVRSRMWPYFEKKFADKGFILATTGDVGFVYVYSQAPIRKIEDLRAARAWVWSDDEVARAMFRKLNIRGVPMGVPDVLPSLTSGRVTAAYAPPLAAVALQWSSKVKYMTSMPLSYSIGATILRKEVWDEVSAADRKISLKVLDKQSRRLQSTVRRDNETARSQLARRGIEIVDSPPALVRDFDNAARAVWQELVGKVYSQEELDRVLKYRDEFRKRKRK